MTYRISKDFEFSASHVLDGLPEGHQCARLHGHNYVVRVMLESEALNEVGFVRDFGDLKVIKDWIDIHLDHRHLNDVMSDNPTSENLAALLYDIARAALLTPSAVGVSETPKTWAWYQP